MTAEPAAIGGLRGQFALRAVVAAGLVVDAVVHLHLAAGAQQAVPGGIGEGNLFRIQAVAALLVAALVLVRGSRMAYLAAALVAGAALVAVVVTFYVDVPAIGPLPSMYEPLWSMSKTVTAVAEAVAVCGALLGLRATAAAARMP